MQVPLTIGNGFILMDNNIYIAVLLLFFLNLRCTYTFHIDVLFPLLVGYKIKPRIDEGLSHL